MSSTEPNTQWSIAVGLVLVPFVTMFLFPSGNQILASVFGALGLVMLVLLIAIRLKEGPER